MRKQTYKNIEHIIVDDGSTDNLDDLVADYIASVDYEVKYIKKANGGKHTATNVAWDNSEGDFIIQLDSDDEFMPDTITKLVDMYRQIPDDEKSEFWCVTGRCVDQVEKKLIGEPYPEDINSMEVSRAKSIADTISGDKVGLMKREMLKNLRYPEPECVTFVTESRLWSGLTKKFRTWYSNEIVLIYYINENEGNTLSDPPKTQQTYSNYSYNLKYELENKELYGVFGVSLCRKVLLYAVYYELSTEEYKAKYSIYLTDDKQANLLLMILRIPVKLLKNYIKKRWNVI